MLFGSVGTPQPLDEDVETPSIQTLAADGNLELLKTIINNTNINTIDDNHLTALTSASSYGHANVVAYLLSMGAHCDMQDEDGDTSLHLCNNASCALLLLHSNHCTPTLINGEGQTAEQVHSLELHELMMDNTVISVRMNANNEPTAEETKTEIDPETQADLDRLTLLVQTLQNERMQQEEQSCCYLFRPCIDIHDGVVKQIVGGTLTDSKETTTTSTSSETTTTTQKEDGNAETNFISEHSASYYSKLYKAKGLKGGHVIMLGRSKQTEEQGLAALQAYPNGLQIGGGVTSKNALKYIQAGASHVIVTSYVFRNGTIDLDRLNEMIEVVGKDQLVLDLSCRYRTFPTEADGKNGYYVVTDRWQNFTNYQITLKNIQFLEKKCSEFLIHGVDVEGLRCGIQEDLVTLLSEIVTIPVTYAGGARSMEDLKKVEVLGKGKISLTIGSALDIFGGDLKLEDVLKYCDGKK